MHSPLPQRAVATVGWNCVWLALVTACAADEPGDVLDSTSPDLSHARADADVASIDASPASDDAGPPVILPGCLPGGWCRVYPDKNYPPLDDLWGSARNDVWAVGGSGPLATPSILHFDGNTWNELANIDSTSFSGVWGSSPDDVWLVGSAPGASAQSRIVHWDGARLAAAPCPDTGPLVDVWGSSAGDVWAVGRTGVLHFDGVKWSAAYSWPKGFGGPFAVWGGGPNQVWVTGLCISDPWVSGGGAYWDGVEWKHTCGFGEVKAGFAQFVRHGAFWGQSSDFWYAANAVIHAVDAKGPVVAGIYGSASAIWGSGSRDIWANGGKNVLQHYDGVTWTDDPLRLSPDVDIRSLWGSAADDVWAAGAQGTLLHYDGKAWSLVRGSSTPTKLTAISDVWANGDDDVWAGLSGGPGNWSVLHYDGKSWSTLPIPMAPRKLSGSGPSDMWAAGSQGGFTSHFDGNGWQQVNTGVGLGPSGYDLFAADRAHVWFATEAGLFRWDGAAFRVAEPGIVAAIYASGAEAWSILVSPAPAFTRTVMHFDGAGWKAISGGWAPSQYGPDRLFGHGPSDLWKVADTGLEHHDGLAWTSHPAPAPFSLKNRVTVGGDSRSLWLHDGQTLIRWNGAGFSVEPPFPLGVSAISRSPGHGVYLGTSEGYLFRHD